MRVAANTLNYVIKTTIPRKFLQARPKYRARKDHILRSGLPRAFVAPVPDVCCPAAACYICLLRFLRVTLFGLPLPSTYRCGFISAQCSTLFVGQRSLLEWRPSDPGDILGRGCGRLAAVSAFVGLQSGCIPGSLWGLLSHHVTVSGIV